MSTTRIIAIIIIVAIVAALAFVAYSFLRTPEAASGPIEAVPIAIEESPVAPTATPLPPTPTEQIAEETAVAIDREVEAETTDSPEPAPTDTPQPEPTAEASQAGTPVIFEIVQSESEASFIIEEVLRGEDKTVVGVTDQIAGEIAIDADNPGNSQVGTILVNARTITTDSDFRNRAIQNRILETDAHEFVSFEPTGLSGLPDEVTVGDSFTFQITGDLTVRDITREVVFDVNVTALSPDRIEGLAETQFLYSDFELAIPDARAVDTVEDELILRLQFAAETKS